MYGGCSLVVICDNTFWIMITNAHTFSIRITCTHRYGQANSMQGHGVFSFARYYGNNEVEFPIRYGAPEDVDKLRGDLLLPGAP